MKKKIVRIISFLMIFFMVGGIFLKAFPENNVEPKNPLKQSVTGLKAEAAVKSGAAGDSSEDESSLMGEDLEDQEEEEPEKEEPEEQENEKDEEKETQEKEKNVEDPEEKKNEEEKTVKEEEEVSKDQQPEGSGEDREQDSVNGEGQNTGKGEENPEKDENGDIPSEGGKDDTDHPGNGETPGEDEHGLVTDLYDHIILFSELEDDTLEFYAYYSDTRVDADIKVNYKHKSDAGNGKWLKKSGTHEYQTKLRLGQNYITIYYTDQKGDRNWTRITLNYQADKAGEKDPVQGKNPPIIKTNLDDWTEDIQIFEFTFTVDAKKYDGSRIYSSCIQVWMDGQLLSNPTGSGVYEYLLKFGRPVEGNTQKHTVAVLAWDDEGNSRYVKYQVRHKVKDEGDLIGTVTIEIDATTLGLGVIDEAEVEVSSGDTAATAVLKMLDEYGYSYTNSGSLEKDFYLSSLSRSDAFRGAEIDERLRTLIERDGISFLPDRGGDVLGEFDYTRGSGWIYFINSDYCPGKAMSGYALNGGERISLRFTLAFGKDVGSSYTDTSTSLSSYCAKWVNGTIIEYGHSYQETERVEATKDSEGYILYICDKCKEEKREPLVYEGPEEPEAPENPGDGETPEVPENPGDGETPEVPENPGDGESPEVPENPGDGEEPEVPENPGDGETPEVPENEGDQDGSLEGEHDEENSSKNFILRRFPAYLYFTGRLFKK